MKNFKLKLKIFFLKVKNYLKHYRKNTLSSRGKYICYYIIEKYINRTDIEDYNEEYEKTIDKTLNRMLQGSFFEKLSKLSNDNPVFSDDEKRHMAAQFTIIITLYACKKEDQQIIYNYIKNDKDRDFIRNFVEKQLAF